MKSHRLLLLACLLPFELSAQDGGQLYTTYCSACHGPDGKGATGGQFPPLAESPWLQGDPARSIKIVLHGLHGPVEVNGQSFNLEMPPQGAVLPDDQIAAILTHVRRSWNHETTAVSTEQVKAVRTATSSRSQPWTSEELRKDHPLPAARPPIAHLVSKVYHGSWQDLPDFSQLEPRNVEEEHDGILSVKDADVDDLFGIVWEGELHAPQDGDYEFLLDADDAARLILNGRTLAEVRGIGPMNGSRGKQVGVTLKQGPQKLRVEYMEFKGQESIGLSWRGPGRKSWQKLSDANPRSGPDPIPLQPVGNRPAIYRNFIAGTSPRAIAFGFPGGVNLAWSADHFGAELIWTGDFMDASRHWIERGQGNQPPAGDRVVRLAGSPTLPENARFRGYQLDLDGNPTFSTQVDQGFLLDQWKSAGDPQGHALRRTLHWRHSDQPMAFLLSEKLPLRATRPGDYELGDQLLLHVEGATLEATPQDQRVVLTLRPNQPVTLTYRWR